MTSRARLSSPKKFKLSHYPNWAPRDDIMLRNVRYAIRLLAKSPAFTLVAVLTVSLGIGANTVIFTVANALLLRPLPYEDPERLALISISNVSGGTTVGSFSYPRFTFLQDHTRSFSGVAAFVNETFNFTDGGEPEQLGAARVSANFFEVLGVRPVLGRGFRAEEDKPGGADVILLSHRLWLSRFAGNDSVLGRKVTLNTRAFTVIGVMPAGFKFDFLPSAVDLWAPRVWELNLATPPQINAGAQFLQAVARLRPGVTLGRAQAELDVLNQQYLREYPKLADANPQFRVTVRNLQEQLVADVRRGLLLLTGAVGLLLLIACSNLASLLLSRALGRKKEIAVRMAVGASRATLIGQLLTESVLLACMGGALGVLLSAAATNILANLLEASLPRVHEMHVDAAVLGFAVAVSIFSGLLFGLIPAVQTVRADVDAGLREEGRGALGSRSRNRFRSALVISQVALSMVLLIGAGLLIRSFIQIQEVKPGFDAANLIAMRIALPPDGYSDNSRMVEFFGSLTKQ